MVSDNYSKYPILLSWRGSSNWYPLFCCSSTCIESREISKIIVYGARFVDSTCSSRSDDDAALLRSINIILLFI